MESSSETEVSSDADKKGVKRKLPQAGGSPSAPKQPTLREEVQKFVRDLHLPVSWTEDARWTAKKAAQGLAEIAKNERNVEMIVEEGGVNALATHLTAPVLQVGEGPVAFEHEVEKECAFALGLLGVKSENQYQIAESSALASIVALLTRGANGGNYQVINSLYRRAADAITNLAHENMEIKALVRKHGGIPPLVALLNSPDSKVQRAGAGALRTLAFKNEANKNLIVECGALPILIFMLRSEDPGIHYEAVGVIGNLVHSSVNIKRLVLEKGALQPIIRLLSSTCSESQREAALLLGQFATEPDCKARIVQRGAVIPLISMLSNSEPNLQEMAAFALGRLAQNPDNQAGIVHDGGLHPLLHLLSSSNGTLQHNAAFALYGMAENEDNVSDIIRAGGVQCLVDGSLVGQASKDCVQKTLKRLEDKLSSPAVLNHLVYLMRQPSVSLVVSRRVAQALALLCRQEDQRGIFLEQGGLSILLDMLCHEHPSSTPHREAGRSLFVLAQRAAALSPVEDPAPPATPQVYLGEMYVNNTTLSDVTFLVEGQRFFAHRIALLASSDAFRAMFDGGYKEKEASDIVIPNISLRVFEAMIRCIYTGSVVVPADMAEDLLRAADQYLLSGLKRICEFTIAKDLSVDNLISVFELAEAYHADSLRQTCVSFVLENFQHMCQQTGYEGLVPKLLPEMKLFFQKVLRPNSQEEDGAAAVA